MSDVPPVRIRLIAVNTVLSELEKCLEMIVLASVQCFTSASTTHSMFEDSLYVCDGSLQVVEEEVVVVVAVDGSFYASFG